jgi:hypothetical protein
MSKREQFRELYAALQANGLLEYGSTIPTELVHATLCLSVPDVAPKSVYDRVALLELAAVDYVRNILLDQGKYITGTASGYRILLPSENAAQVDQYMSSADRKLVRALKLSRNTPRGDVYHNDQTEARILMKRAGIKQGAAA